MLVPKLCFRMDWSQFWYSHLHLDERCILRLFITSLNMGWPLFFNTESFGGEILEKCLILRNFLLSSGGNKLSIDGLPAPQFCCPFSGHHYGPLERPAGRGDCPVHLVGADRAKGGFRPRRQARLGHLPALEYYPGPLWSCDGPEPQYVSLKFSWVRCLFSCLKKIITSGFSTVILLAIY